MLIVAIVLMFIGLVGILIPGLPGTGLIFLATLFYGWVTKFQQISLGWIVIFGILTALTFVFEYVSSMIGAKKFGASKAGIIGGILGGIAGLLILNIPGLFIGQFVGTLLGELYSGKAFKSSAKSGVGTVLGNILGLVVNTSIALFIIITFLFKTLR